MDSRIFFLAPLVLMAAFCAGLPEPEDTRPTLPEGWTYRYGHAADDRHLAPPELWLTGPDVETGPWMTEAAAARWAWCTTDPTTCPAEVSVGQ